MADGSDIAPAITTLREQQTQLDADGIYVGVSREALDAVLDEIERLRAQAPGWRGIGPEDQRGQHLLGAFHNTVRFKLYKKGSEQYRRGIAGRWQKADEYGGWNNCEAPTAILPSPPAEGGK